MDLETTKAEQQLIGFSMGQRINLEELLDSMGLTKEEWEIIKEEGTVLISEKDEIDRYFENK